MPFGGLLSLGLIQAGSSIIGGLGARRASQQQQQATQTASRQARRGIRQSNDLITGGTDQANQTLRDFLGYSQGALQGGTGRANELISGSTADANRMLGAAGNQANETLASLLARSREAFSPYTGVGAKAAEQLSAGIGAGGAFESPQFTFDHSKWADPGLDFRIQQGTRAIDASGAAKGLSGGTLKALARYGQEAGSQEYQNAYERALASYGANENARGNTFTRLSQLAALGRGAAGAGLDVDANTLSSIAGNQLGVGTRQAGNVAAAGGAQAGNEFNLGQLLSGNLMNAGGRIAGNTQSGSMARAANLADLARMLSGYQIDRGNAAAAGTAGVTNAVTGGLAGFGGNLAAFLGRGRRGNGGSSSTLSAMGPYLIGGGA